MSADDDNEIGLSTSAKQILQQFLSDQQSSRQKFEWLQRQADQDHQGGIDDADGIDGIGVELADFQEDWQMSQFWYDDATALFLANQIIMKAGPKTRIALVSAPSVFIKIREVCKDASLLKRVVLFEYDARFSVFGRQFIKYDYNSPALLPAELQNSFTRVLVDPPFLQEECQTKAALTVRWLSQQPERLLVCTGERMSELIRKIYKVGTTTFHPKHKGGLANEFRCFSNFESNDLLFCK